MSERWTRGSDKVEGAGREPLAYVLVPSAFGTLGIVWQETGRGPKVRRVFLPSERTSAEESVRGSFRNVKPRSCPAVVELGERIQTFLGGGAVSFRLSLMALDCCSAFQRRVLLVEFEIPRGRVSTYARIAGHLGIPRGARAVGGALARNPFPIVVPCHRAIRSNGQLGGFQGGLEMKRALLELEGLEIGPTGRVLSDRLWY